MLRVKIIAPAIALAGAAIAFGQAAPVKVGIIHVQNAIVSTRDGQKAVADLQNRFTPRKEDLDKKQTEIKGLQEQLQRGSNTISEDARNKLIRDIDEKTKRLQRDTEDAQMEFDQEQGKVMQDVGGKLMAVLDKYAKENGYAVILDVSAQTTPVLWAANGIDITKDVIDLYDKAPASAPAPSSGAEAKPAGSAPAATAPKPPASSPPAVAAPKPATNPAPKPPPAKK
jgi:outer membrane protein